MDYFITYKNGGGTVVDWDFTNPIHCLTWHKQSKGYVQANIPGGHVYMHRLLLGFPKEIDHINGKKNDNRLSNLRSVSSRQNKQNMEKHRNGKLPGTRFEKNGKLKWVATCMINGKQKHIGVYKTEIEAHMAYVMYTRGL